MVKVTTIILGLSLLAVGCEQADMKEARERFAAQYEVKPERYQVFKSESGETWRLDTATGETCLLLATAARWKKSSTEGCQ